MPVFDADFKPYYEKDLRINTGGILRIVRKGTQLYVTGEELLLPVDSQEEGWKIIAEYKAEEADAEKNKTLWDHLKE